MNFWTRVFFSNLCIVFYNNKMKLFLKILVIRFARFFLAFWKKKNQFESFIFKNVNLQFYCFAFFIFKIFFACFFCIKNRANFSTNKIEFLYFYLLYLLFNKNIKKCLAQNFIPKWNEIFTVRFFFYFFLCLKNILLYSV